MLGLPMFYHTNPFRLSGTKFSQDTKAIAEVLGSTFQDMETMKLGKSQQYMNKNHIQCLVNWIFLR
jgi:hypothetical protein